MLPRHPEPLILENTPEHNTRGRDEEKANTSCKIKVAKLTSNIVNY